MRSNLGGRRPGAGRPRLHPAPGLRGPGVPHRRRPSFERRSVLHVTLRLRAGLPSLRSGRVFRLLRGLLSEARERLGLRLVHYSVQSNHVHLLVEADDGVALGRGMRGLCTRLARRINGFLRRRGPVLADRYHARLLKTPREVRLALQYVLNNARRHGLRLPPGSADPCSTGPWFDGWVEGRPNCPARESPPVAPPQSWLLSVGWRRHGLLSVGFRPGGA